MAYSLWDDLTNFLKRVFGTAKKPPANEVIDPTPLELAPVSTNGDGHHAKAAKEVA